MPINVSVIKIWESTFLVEILDQLCITVALSYLMIPSVLMELPGECNYYRGFY